MSESRFTGKTVVITGGGRGLGRAMALAFAAEGAAVAVWDIDEAAAASVAGEIASSRGYALSRKVNVSGETEVEAAFGDLFQRWDALDVLINNAGICRTEAIEAITGDSWDAVLAVNLKGTFLCAKAVMGRMKHRRRGVILNMGSIAGKIGGIATGAHYAASKAAVMCLTKSLARDTAPYNVRVNALSPGVVKPDMTRTITGGDYSAYLDQIPMGRIGEAEDVARAALFLASDAAAYITGEIIDVNGGQFMD